MITLSPQAIVRAQARAALKNNYARAVIAFLILMLPVFLLDAASTVIVIMLNMLISDSDIASITSLITVITATLIGGVLASPFINGFVRVFYRNAFTGDMDLNDLFYYFEGGRYHHTLALNLTLILRLLIPAALAYLPVILFSIICTRIGGSFVNSVLYNDFYVILTILSTIILTLYSLRYYALFTVYVENENLSICELFRTSKHIMRSQSVSAAKLIFSYTPWMLLCFTVLPMLYVIPYMTQGLCIGAKWMTRAAYER